MIPFAAYDRASLRPTVVHVGPGGFHRAHQAVYADTLLRSGERSGAIRAVSLRSSAAGTAGAGRGGPQRIPLPPRGTTVGRRAPDRGAAGDRRRGRGDRASAGPAR